MQIKITNSALLHFKQYSTNIEYLVSKKANNFVLRAASYACHNMNVYLYQPTNDVVLSGVV